MAENILIVGPAVIVLVALVGFLLYRYQSRAVGAQLQAERGRMDAAMLEKERDLQMELKEELQNYLVS